MKKLFYVLSSFVLLLSLSNHISESAYASTSKCSYCKGSGYVKCSSCKGSGEGDSCATCNGEGWVGLMGDEVCPDCNGNGLFMCGSCNGKGEVICIKCAGKGTVTSSASGNTSKKKNPVTIKTSVKTVTTTALKKAKRTIKPLIITKAQGTVTVKKIKNGTTSSIYKRVTVSKKTGAITLAKGKYKKGIYKVKLSIAIAGNWKYAKVNRTVTVKFKIK